MGTSLDSILAMEAGVFKDTQFFFLKLILKQMNNKFKDRLSWECLLYFYKMADKVSSWKYLGSQKTLRCILESINLNMSK